MFEPTTRGDPESPLRWTCRSLRELAKEFAAQGHIVSHRVVGDLLKQLGYNLQANRKTWEGATHVDRDAQFQLIDRYVQTYQAREQPVISVDTKKKELVGCYKNADRQWRPEGQPESVKVHDFVDQQLGRAYPYGVYDLSHNEGWVSVGTDHDTASFAVESIRRWWRAMGQALYPQATELLITAEGGGSNGSWVRLWKVELQTLANELNLAIRVAHLPPGTSKWNKIEHRLFSFISMNWCGQPLISHEVILILLPPPRPRPVCACAPVLTTHFVRPESRFPTPLSPPSTLSAIPFMVIGIMSSVPPVPHACNTCFVTGSNPAAGPVGGRVDGGCRA